jgi:uncharacterized protein DUF1918
MSGRGSVKEEAVATVGDKIRVLSNKGDQPPREGLVTGVSGNLLRIRWSSGEETSLIPGPGAVTVVGRARVGSATKSTPKKASPKTKTAASKSARPVAKKPKR